MRKIGQGSYFFSKDQFWWNGTVIEHDHVDEATNFRDINNQMIYELDLVEYSIEEDSRSYKGAVLWSKPHESFVIKDLHHKELLVPMMAEELPLFEPRDLKFYAYLYDNPELMLDLGVRDE